MSGRSEIVTGEPAARSDSTARRWLGVALATLATTVAASAMGLPAPELFAALLVGLSYALIAARRPLDVPAGGTAIGQALIGVAIGAELDASTLRAVASSWFGVSLVTLGTLALSVGVGIAVARVTAISQPTGTLGLIAGGASGIVAMADELGADSRLVAFMQYLRVLAVVLVAPLVASVLLGHGDPGMPETEPTGMSFAGDLAFTAGCALAGALVARRLRFSAATLLCPLAVAAILSVSGIADHAAVPGLVRSVAFALIGLQIGLRFTSATVREARALLPWVLAAVILLIVVSALLAALLVPLAHVSFADAYLATTPGGLPVVLAVAVGVGTNSTFVVSVQVLRLLVMVIAAPPLVRVLARWDNAPGG